jgi:hypothetical protein
MLVDGSMLYVGKKFSNGVYVFGRVGVLHSTV